MRSGTFDVVAIRMAPMMEQRLFARVSPALHKDKLPTLVAVESGTVAAKIQKASKRPPNIWAAPHAENRIADAQGLLPLSVPLRGEEDPGRDDGGLKDAEEEPEDEETGVVLASRGTSGGARTSCTEKVHGADQRRDAGVDAALQPLARLRIELCDPGLPVSLSGPGAASASVFGRGFADAGDSASAGDVTDAVGVDRSSGARERRAAPSAFAFSTSATVLSRGPDGFSSSGPGLRTERVHVHHLRRRSQ
ncbi:hypothetical protein LX36DRAFT_675836 [Colletotrichum falcatum]|nr:hypothetical protein LX36DRAFT_675836 [Colletotrichum falcatum]